MKNLIVSIVVYNTPLIQLQKVINNLQRSSSILLSIYIFDNSPNIDLENYCFANNFQYYASKSNIGFGNGHNHTFKCSFNKSDTFLILNPDVFLDGTHLESVIDYLHSSPDIGLLSPRLLNSDSSIQEICRYIPSPFSLFFRRFFKSKIIHPMNYSSTPIPVPFIHGACFFIKSKVMHELDGFDPRFFLYMEDADLCRRVWSRYQVILYPHVSAYHIHGKGSYKNLKLFFHHIFSAVYYFNKWGWLIDFDRLAINKRVYNF